MKSRESSGPFIKGLGNDIIEIERIRASVIRYGGHFLSRLFSIDEQHYCLKHKDPSVHVAGRFAAKEAIAKALGCGFGEKLSWLDIEIINNEAGQPIVSFSDRLNQLFDYPHVMVSISHSKDYATAVAIWSA